MRKAISKPIHAMTGDDYYPGYESLVWVESNSGLDSGIFPNFFFAYFGYLQVK